MSNSPHKTIKRNATGALFLLEEKPASETTKTTTTVPVAQNVAKTDSATAGKTLASVSKVAITDGAAGAAGATGAGGADAAGAGMPTTGGGHIMISYQWASKTTMLRARDKLMQAGYRVWMDVDNMS